MLAEGLLSRESVYGTIHIHGINANGDLCGATTTSGLSFKIPDGWGIRHPGVRETTSTATWARAARPGAARPTSTAYRRFSSSRRCAAGASKDAIAEALRRIKARTIEKRLLKPDGTPQLRRQVLRAERGRRARRDGDVRGARAQIRRVRPRRTAGRRHGGLFAGKPS
jgi:N4-(beta-N-acetylglucosaminyl)-L-asparaginase